MPEYKVLGVGYDRIMVAKLSVVDEEGRVFVLDVKGMSDADFLNGMDIFVKTTNREILPHDINIPDMEEELPEVEIPQVPEMEIEDDE